MTIKKISKNVISIKDSNNKEIIYVTQSYCSHKNRKERNRINQWFKEFYGKDKEILRLNKIIEKQHEDIIKLKEGKIRTFQIEIWKILKVLDGKGLIITDEDLINKGLDFFNKFQDILEENYF